jgi:hypothetical protein
MFADVSPDEWIDAVLGQALRCFGPAALFEPIRDLRRPGRSDERIGPQPNLWIRGADRAGSHPRSQGRSPPRRHPWRGLPSWLLRLSFAAALAVPSQVVEVDPQLTLLDLPASDDPTWPTPGENGRLLEARPSSMMEAARVRKGILQSLRAAIPPVHRTRRRAVRQARTGVGGWGDYFSDTTSPLVYRTVGCHNALKFHIFLEN